jgi:hypothetical protein
MDPPYEPQNFLSGWDVYQEVNSISLPTHAMATNLLMQKKLLLL